MVRIAGESPRTARYIKLSPPGKDDPIILCCEIAGEGPPIVLVPGLGDTVWVWRHLIPFLHPHHRVTALELRGHGRSASPYGPYFMEEIVQDISLLLDKLNFPSATFIAQGFGARAALILAVERPEIASALILIGPETGAPTAAVRTSLIERMKQASRGDMRSAYKTRKSAGLDPRGMSSQERAEHHRLFLRNSPSGYAAACSAELNAADLSGRLGVIACPVLSVVGELDPDHLENAKQMAETIPDCETVIVEGAGHFVQLDQRDSFHTLIEDFLRKHNLSKSSK